MHTCMQKCAYIHLAPTLRARVRWALQRLEDKKPGTLLRFLNTLDSILEKDAARLKPRNLPQCTKCGEPTAPGRKICKLCELLEAAGIDNPKYVKWRKLIAGRSTIKSPKEE